MSQSPFRHNARKDSVLAMLNGVRDEFEDVLPIPCDARPQYIAFEVVSAVDHLNEKKTLTRGANCTSVDPLNYGFLKLTALLESCGDKFIIQ